MKTNIFLVLTMLLVTSSSGAISNDLRDLRLCLKEAESYQDEQIAKCYDLALPWAHSSSLMGRALYSKILQLYLSGGADRGHFSSIGKKLFTYFQTHLEPQINFSTIAKLENAELEAVFEALQGTQFYSVLTTPGDAVLTKLNLIFTVMETRKTATEPRAVQFFRALLTSNKWNEAKTLQARWPVLVQEVIPNIRIQDEVTASELGYYSLSPDMSELVLKKFDPSTGTTILISGDCHYAIDAIKVLDQKKDISDLMAQHGLVIGGTDYKAIDQMRKQYPNFEVHVTHNLSSWFGAGVDVFIMPSFSFIKDGKMTYRFTGTGENLVGDFCRGLKSTGMKLPSSCEE
jgi:hypothetical protein